MYSAKNAHELRKSRELVRKVKNGRSWDNQPVPRALLQFNLQYLIMQVQESQKFPNEWQDKNHETCRDKHTCVNKSKLEIMHQKCIVSTNIISIQRRHETEKNQSSTNKSYITVLIILLILLVPPICLGMCNSISKHIHTYLSKPRLLFEINGGINEQCLQWVPFKSGTITQDCSIAGIWTYHKAFRRVL